MDFGSPPFEGSGGLRIGGDESVNRGAQLPYVTEASSFQGSAGEQTEPDFDLIEPRSRSTELGVARRILSPLPWRAE